MAEEWTEEYNVNDLGLTTGSIVALNSQRVTRKKRHPIGFVASETKPRKKRGQRRPGDWPEVPKFDVLEGE